MNAAELSALSKGDIENALVASTPGGIERQEAQGQIEMINSKIIPKQIIGATREELTAIGFSIGEEFDDLFIYCDLPTGWIIKPTNHAMHSNLVDDQGRKRARIFYKASFYDRKADMGMLCRYRVNGHASSPLDRHYRYVVCDCDTIIFDAGEWFRADYHASDLLNERCIKWLDTNHPDWKNPLAYW